MVATSDVMKQSKCYTLVILIVIVISPGCLLYTRLVHQLSDAADPRGCAENRATRIALDSVLYDKLPWDLSVAVYLSVGRVWFLFECAASPTTRTWFIIAFVCTIVCDVGVGALALAGTSLCNGERPVVIAAVCGKQEFSDYVSRSLLLGSCGLLLILFVRTCLQGQKQSDNL